MRIDLFYPPLGQYNVIQHFTRRFYEALQRRGVRCRLLTASYNNPKPFLEELFRDKPDCTLSFNGLLPDEKGNFFCDMVKIPHVTYLTDAPNRFVSLINSPRTIVAHCDRFSGQFLRGLNYNRVVFLPHAADPQEQGDVAADRPYDVLLMASALDYEELRSSWTDDYPEGVCRAMAQACDDVFNHSGLNYVQAFVNALDSLIAQGVAINTERLNFPQIFEDIEAYIRGRDRVELVRAITTARIDLFSGDVDLAIWKKYLKGQANITYHPAVPFEEALSLMQKAKILLNSSPTITTGAHERIFSGMAAGALLVTNSNDYLIEQGFVDGQDLLFYDSAALATLDRQINGFLADETLRRQVARRGQQRTLAHHTWDQRATTLVQELPALLAAIK